MDQIRDLNEKYSTPPWIVVVVVVVVVAAADSGERDRLYDLKKSRAVALSAMDRRCYRHQLHREKVRSRFHEEDLSDSFIGGNMVPAVRHRSELLY
ncbi:hypothetical protein PanWU01x14_057820 [Parasponia andersonii]|uniref:Transmembrane protein n=1 Tax=Parasponia andersonii TaxID=3476 RepID=A0A2P5DK07_PARAD|nr:hypothetical protein PanWU01x14_057820 [Parasponia andersonii]